MSEEEICVYCHAKFTLSQAMLNKCEQNGWPKPTHCPACTEKKRKYTKLICASCHEEFEVSVFIEEQLRKRFGNKFKMPRYCAKCRNAWLAKKGVVTEQGDSAAR